MNEDLYAILGVSTDADPAVVRAAYLALVRLYHPDAASDPADRVRAEQRTKDLNAAYSVLSDPKRRATYDELRRRPRLSMARPSRAAPAPKPISKSARRKGPSLQDRRERLRRVRLVSVALAVGAVVLIFGAFTGAVGMLRPALPTWLSPRASHVSAPNAEPMDVSEVPGEVMLPWPMAEGARAPSMGAAGMRLAFQPVKAGEAPVVIISDHRGSTIRIEGVAALSAGQDNLFGIGRIAGAPKPAVVVLATPSGQDCCLRLRLVHSVGARLEVADLGEVPADVAQRFPSDVDGDGVREWILPDRRFTAAFGPSSPPPPLIFRFEGGRFRNVSAGGDYDEIFSNHLASAQRLCTLGSRGACAAFVASAARLGKAEWAWDIMLRNYGRDRVHDAREACTAPAGAAASCPDTASDGFPAKLREFLVQAAYVRSVDGLGDQAPQVAQ